MSKAAAEDLLAAARGLLEQDGLPGPSEDWHAASDALKKAEEAQRIFEECADQDGALSAARHIIGARLALGEAGPARRAATEKIAAAQASGEKKGEAMMLLALAEVQLASLELKEASASATKAMVIFQKTGNAAMEFYALQKVVVNIHFAKGEMKEALQAAGQAMMVSKRLDEAARADASFLLASTRLASGAKDSLAVAEEAFALYKQVGDKKGQANSLDLIAQINLSKEEVQAAVESAKESLEIFRAIHHASGMVNALGRVVSAHIQKEDGMKALQIVDDEEKAFRREGNQRGLAGCAALKFLAHSSIPDHSNEAVDEAQTALNLFRELGDRKSEADMWYNISGVHLRARMYDETLHEAQEALMLYRDLQDAAGVEAASFVLSQVYCQRGQPLLAPSRPEALELVHKMAEAIGLRDGDAFHEASERLNVIGGACLLVTQEEQNEILYPVIRRDPEGAAAFVRAHSPAGDLADTPQGGGGGVNRHFREVDKRILYINFRISGIGYGPRFRPIDLGTHLVGDSPVDDDEDVLAYAALKVQSAAEDWERELRLNPSMIDGSLHVGANIPPWVVKAPVKEEKTKGKK